MKAHAGSGWRRRGVTIFEFAGIIVVLALLSSVSIGRFAAGSHGEQEYELRRTLEGVRQAIELFREDSLVTGSGRYPTVGELNTPGVVIEGAFPMNPFNESASIRIEILEHGDEPETARKTHGMHGWVYDPLSGNFWSNCSLHDSNRW